MLRFALPSPSSENNIDGDHIKYYHLPIGGIWGGGRNTGPLTLLHYNIALYSITLNFELNRYLAIIIISQDSSVATKRNNAMFRAYQN